MGTCGSTIDALTISTGLHFTELDIRCTHAYLLSAVRLAEACGNTLTKLSYTISFHGKISWPG